MTVVGDSGLPRDAGRRDALHHRERLRKKITEQLKQRIGEEDIIASGPEKKVRVPVKGTKRWQFIFDRGRQQGVGQGDGKPGDVLGPSGNSSRRPGEAGLEPGEELYEVWLDMADVEEMLFSELELPRLKPKNESEIESSRTVYDEIARKGPMLDKKATLRENLLRNAKRGQVSLGGIEKPDLRYLTYRDVPKPRSRAVIFLAMDVSGSMDANRKRMARLFFYWCVQFLRSRYDQTEIVFVVAHDRGPRSHRGGVLQPGRVGRHEGLLGVRGDRRDAAPSLPGGRLERVRAARLRRRQLLRRQPPHAGADPVAGAHLLARRLPRGRPRRA